MAPILLTTQWFLSVCVLAAFSVMFGIIYWLIWRVNRSNRNLPLRPIQEEYTEQYRELVLPCSRYHLFDRNSQIVAILMIHHQSQRDLAVDKDSYYMVDAIQVNERIKKNSLLIVN